MTDAGGAVPADVLGAWLGSEGPHELYAAAYVYLRDNYRQFHRVCLVPGRTNVPRDQWPLADRDGSRARLQAALASGRFTPAVLLSVGPLATPCHDSLLVRAYHLVQELSAYLWELERTTGRRICYRPIPIRTARETRSGYLVPLRSSALYTGLPDGQRIPRDDTAISLGIEELELPLRVHEERRHPEQPSVHICPLPGGSWLGPSFPVEELLVSRAPRLRIALAPGPTALRFASALSGPTAGQPHPTRGMPFQCRSVDPAGRDEVRARVLETLVKANRRQVDVLLFPELTIDRELLGAVQDWLRDPARHRDPHLALVLAGSFHQTVGNECRNRACVLDGSGTERWIQDKCTPFCLDRQEVDAMDPVLRDRLGLRSGLGGWEGISVADTVTAVDCCLGRVAVCICVDALDGRTVTGALRRAEVNVYLVPAMSGQVRRFRDAANTLAGAVRGTTAFCNSAWIRGHRSPGTTPNDGSFLRLPRKGEAAAAETPAVVEEDGNGHVSFYLFEVTVAYDPAPEPE